MSDFGDYEQLIIDSFNQHRSSFSGSITGGSEISIASGTPEEFLPFSAPPPSEEVKIQDKNQEILAGLSRLAQESLKERPNLSTLKSAIPSPSPPASPRSLSPPLSVKSHNKALATPVRRSTRNSGGDSEIIPDNLTAEKMPNKNGKQLKPNQKGKDQDSGKGKSNAAIKELALLKTTEEFIQKATELFPALEEEFKQMRTYPEEIGLTSLRTLLVTKEITTSTFTNVFLGFSVGLKAGMSYSAKDTQQIFLANIDNNKKIVQEACSAVCDLRQTFESTVSPHLKHFADMMKESQELITELRTELHDLRVGPDRSFKKKPPIPPALSSSQLPPKKTVQTSAPSDDEGNEDILNGLEGSQSLEDYTDPRNLEFTAETKNRELTMYTSGLEVTISKLPSGKLNVHVNHEIQFFDHPWMRDFITLVLKPIESSDWIERPRLVGSALTAANYLIKRNPNKTVPQILNVVCNMLQEGIRESPI